MTQAFRLVRSGSGSAPGSQTPMGLKEESLSDTSSIGCCSECLESPTTHKDSHNIVSSIGV